MANDELNITINLPFPTAGVNFNIKMNSADGSSGAFSLNVSNLATGDAVGCIGPGCLLATKQTRSPARLSKAPRLNRLLKACRKRAI